MSEDYQIIKSLIESVLDKMGINAGIEIVKGIDFPIFTIVTDEAGILIGENGQNLFSLSHVLKKMTGKAFKDANKEMPQFSIDVNGYYTKKINDLKESAKMSAQRARFFKKEIILEPMNAFERKMVHLALSECPDIKTESVGEGNERKIVVKPI